MLTLASNAVILIVGNAYSMITTLETVLFTRALERKVVSSKLLHICKSKEFVSFNGAGIFEGWTLILLRTGFAQITLRYGLRLVHPVTCNRKLVVGWEVNKVDETVYKSLS